MTTETLHPLAEAYLDRLERAAAHLPRARRRDLVDDIEAHLQEALEETPSDDDVRAALARLGTPEQIVAAEAPPPPPSPRRRGAREWWAVMLLPFGPVAVVSVGVLYTSNNVLWIAAALAWLGGLYLLVGSHAWTWRDKLIGALLWPGGLLGSFYVAAFIASVDDDHSPGHITAGEWLLGGFAGLVPLATAVYLAARARRP